MRRLGILVVAAVAMAASVSAATDVWESGAGDDGAGTDNELVAGVSQQHDLQAVGGVADQDWYLVGQHPLSSYEVIVDGLTEEVAITPANTLNDAIGVDLVDNVGTPVVGGAPISPIGASRSLRWRNPLLTNITNQFVRVRPALNGCGTVCTASAAYRISMRETTMFAARFNNGGTQITVLLLQNGSQDALSYGAHFFSAAGVHLATVTGTLNGHGGGVIPTQAIAQLAGMSGSIRIEHNGRYGSLVGKTVALEPATGFSFDTPLVPRIY